MTDHELTITRVFHAPREMVFRAWTDPDQFGRWLGPEGFAAASVTMDVRPGGRWRTCIRNETDGAELWSSGVYREIAEPERLVFTFQWEEQPGDPTLVTIDFAALGTDTEMTFHQKIFESVEERDGHAAGWSSSFDLLAAFLAVSREERK